MILSKRQDKQHRLRRALGTVKGFHGYLHNLQSCLHQTGVYYRFETIELMHERLKIYEAELRKQLGNIK